MQNNVDRNQDQQGQRSDIPQGNDNRSPHGDSLLKRKNQNKNQDGTMKNNPGNFANNPERAREDMPKGKPS